jgi:hypothetical protein
MCNQTTVKQESSSQLAMGIAFGVEQPKQVSLCLSRLNKLLNSKFVGFSL